MEQPGHPTKGMKDMGRTSEQAPMPKGGDHCGTRAPGGKFPPPLRSGGPSGGRPPSNGQV